MTETILLVGATGMLVSQIARELIDKPQVRLRLLIRPGTRDTLRSLLDRGAEIIEGNLADAASLDRATQGVDVIVSAVQGGREVIVDGQVALAQAGRRNGARRILPSDYALDLFKATPGEHAAFDMRHEADDRIAEHGLQANVLQFGFMQMFTPGLGAIDIEKGTIGFFGDGTRPVEVTSVADTAAMIARVTLDRDVPPGKFAFAGDRVSFREAGAVVGRHVGRVLKPVSYGSEADLRLAHAAAPVRSGQGRDVGVPALHDHGTDGPHRSAERPLPRPQLAAVRRVRGAGNAHRHAGLRRPSLSAPARAGPQQG